MKNGKTLMELAAECSRIRDKARDFIVPTESLRAEVQSVYPDAPAAKAAPALRLSFEAGKAGTQTLGLNRWSSGQLATYTDIPRQYFDRIHAENPQLLADSVNHGLQQAARTAKAERKQESRMVRTLDGNVRGLLSGRYRVLDSHDMLEAILPTILDKGMQVVSSEITEQRLFLKVLSPRLTSEVKKGDAVQYGLTISTSDVGAGSVRVEPLIYRLVCLNGMISNTAVRKYHVGKNQGEGDAFELFSDKTKELSDAAFWAQVRDIVLASMKPENFEREVDRLRVAANEEIKNFDLPRVVELTMKAVNVTGEAKKNSILAALASGNEGAGLTKWGLINSFTRAAHVDDSMSYEESVEMERAAGSILELPPSAWRTIAAVSA
jgi:hypothetical protein